MENIKKENFDPHLKEKFDVNSEEHGAVEVELVETADKSNDVTDCFTLLFKGSKEKLLDQKLYKVKHAKMGELDLFMTPVFDEDKDAFYYESVFNRLKEKK